MVNDQRQPSKPVEFDAEPESRDQAMPTKAPVARPAELLDAPVTADEEHASAKDMPVAEFVPERPRRSWLTWIIVSVLLLLLISLGFEAFDFVQAAFDRHEFFGITVLMLIVTAFLGLGAMIWRELQAFRELIKVETLKKTAASLLSSESYGESQTVIPPLEKLYVHRPGLSRELALFQHADHHDLSDAERIRKFESIVLTRVDGQIRDEILRSSRDITLMTAILPLGLVDSAFVLFRSLRMMRRIAQLYGVRPSWLVSVRLFRRILAQSAIAGASEIVADTATHALGASLVSVVSTKMAQGVTNGILAARVGLTVMEQVRPLPFHENARPSLGDLRNELLKRLPEKT